MGRVLTKIGVLLGAVAAFAGCAEERDLIDRVQPYALEKSYFVGENLSNAADDPEFWTQGTLVDVGYGGSQSGLFTSTYAQPLSRIRFEITESMLIGRLSYERIDNSDGKGAALGTTGAIANDGVIVVAFPIEKHFDIQNAYNSTTGEELNIVNENTTDRPWYERKFMRVDWSRNLNVDSFDFDTLSQLHAFGGITYSSLKYDVTDPNHPHAAVFDLENGYFDITNKAFAAPNELDLSYLGWGIDSFPACFLDADFSGGTAPAGSCNPIELTIRHSFRKVVDNDYEPKHWDGYRFQAFGAFYSERSGYDRNYTMTDDRWYWFINRYNIWDRSFYYEDPTAMTGPVECFTPETTKFGQDPERDEDGNGTHDECEAVTTATGVGGSQCNIFRQRCTLPYQLRKVRPMVWHNTEESNLEYFEGTIGATVVWDAAMRVAVQTTKYSECTDVGGSKEECLSKFPVYFGQQTQNDDLYMLMMDVQACKNAGDSSCNAIAEEIGNKRGYDPAVISIAQMDPVVALCHSPVEANDDPLCGDARLPAGLSAEDCEALRLGTGDEDNRSACDSALSVRMGDLRYHQVNNIKFPQTNSPWGIMVDAVDPLTGESISASINVWTHVNDIISQRMLDRYRYLAGELKVSDVTEGKYIREWSNAAKRAGRGIASTFTKEQLNERLNAFTNLPQGMQRPQLPVQLRIKANQIKQQLRNVRASIDAVSTSAGTYAARAAVARGTPMEAKLMTPMIQQLQGIAGMPMSGNVMNIASPLRGGNPTFQRQIALLREQALAERGACILKGESAAPLGHTAVATLLQRKFGDFNGEDDPSVQFERADRMNKYIAQVLHQGVIVHEMGHSVGLRHNFISSAAALFYRPQYWQLRTKNGTVTDECETLSDGEDCIGPRYFDVVTEEEKDNLIWMWMQSSVMDYPGERSQEFLGLGAYDFAAARMLYGDTVSVFADESYNIGTPRAAGLLPITDNIGGITGLAYKIGEEDIHYSALQKNFDLISNCKPVNVEDFKPKYWNEALRGPWDPTLDGWIVKVGGEFTRCDQPEVDYVRWESLDVPTADDAGGFYSGGNAIDKDGRLRVPYNFGTDTWADLGNLSVYRSDNGADAYELFDFFISDQEVNHIFQNYRRGRQTFSVRGAFGRVLSSNEKLRDAAKGLGLFANIYKDFTLDQGFDFDTFWPALAPTFFKDQLLASSLAFDHFTHLLARPQAGEHYVDSIDSRIMRSSDDTVGNAGATAVIIPNGVTGFFDTVGFGGRPVENALADNKGEFDYQFIVNAGSYYDKIFTAMLFTESVDNFISSTRRNFVEARGRAVSMADLFPDGYRRWLANNLTNDAFIKGARLAANTNGRPQLDFSGYPAKPIGWTSWWGSQPRVCFPSGGTKVCGMMGGENGKEFGALTNAEDGDAFDPARILDITDTVVLDPQVGFEQQMFLISLTMLYLPANRQQWWIDTLRIWELGEDADPGFANRIEFHNPTGKVYIAKTMGKETIFGKRVQKGIAARVLEYANDLLQRGYETTPVDLNGDGIAEWYLPVLDEDGQAIVKWDSSLQAINAAGGIDENREGCNENDNSLCTCASNRACVELSQYVEVPFFLRETMDAYGLGRQNVRGIY